MFFIIFFSVINLNELKYLNFIVLFICCNDLYIQKV